MEIRLDGIYRKFKVKERPVWRDGSSYPSEPENWSYRQWAWEFLRRNPAYQEDCRKVDREPSWLASWQTVRATRGGGSQGMLADRLRNAETAARYGRCELKWFGEEYRDEEDEERFWLAETVTPVKVRRPSGSEIRMDLENGQVAIIFDLNRCLKSGQAAKASMLAHAKAILDQELATYDAKLPIGRRSKSVKVHRHKLFLWLRLYDAIEHAKAERGEVAEILYKHLLEGSVTDRQHRMTEARKRISADLKRAKEMVEHGYHGLVPLDSLQNRSSVREA